MERLNKVLAQAGIASRRKADEIIEAGLIKVNGKVVRTLGYLVDRKDIILYHDEPIYKETKEYYLLNKPRGVITSCADEKGRPTVMDIFRQAGIKTRLFPVGRLDYDTAGLLVVTNDGTWANILIHPRTAIEKEYQVKVKGLFPRNLVISLNQKRFVMVGNIKYPFLKLNLIKYLPEENNSLLEIIITAGKNHHVKNLFAALDYPVLTLTRTRIDQLVITSCKRGSFRPLKIHEIKRIFAQKKQ